MGPVRGKEGERTDRTRISSLNSPLLSPPSPLPSLPSAGTSSRSSARQPLIFSRRRFSWRVGRGAVQGQSAGCQSKEAHGVDLEDGQ